MEVYQLIKDGVRNVDSMTNIIGRNVMQKMKKFYNQKEKNNNNYMLENQKQKKMKMDVFLLIILIENKVDKYLEYYNKNH